MKKFLILSALATLLHVSQQYILLTASVDDVEDLAKQLSKSPVVDELHRIWRRASQQFKQQIRKPTKYQGRHDNEYDGRRLNTDAELESLGRNASVYIKAFRKMMNNFEFYL